MDRFLRGLLLDLEHRTLKLRNRVAAIDTNSNPDLNDQAVLAYRYLESTRRSVAHLLQDPALQEPRLLMNYLQLYKRWSEVTELVESFVLPFVERYSEHDRRLTYLCRMLAKQVNWPLPTPLVCGFSTQYFWTKPEFNLVAVPAGEGESLLALPDLCHEMGHVLLAHRSPPLLGNFLQDLTAHFRAERRRLESEQRPPNYRRLIEQLHAMWRDAWVWEFASDMIATFLVGASFGWQHVRLCTNLGQLSYYPALGHVAGHPANEARMQGILVTVRKMGGMQVAADLDRLWGRYLALGGEKPPLDYAVCYPQHLIKSLASNIVHGCAALGLKPFDGHGQSADSIPALAVAAWETFMQNPDIYGAWESERLSALWRTMPSQT